jgi:hypothetical protein
VIANVCGRSGEIFVEASVSRSAAAALSFALFCGVGVHARTPSATDREIKMAGCLRPGADIRHFTLRDAKPIVPVVTALKSTPADTRHARDLVLYGDLWAYRGYTVEVTGALTDDRSEALARDRSKDSMTREYRQRLFAVRSVVIVSANCD